jgi:hypothetical protein
LDWLSEAAAAAVCWEASRPAAPSAVALAEICRNRRRLIGMGIGLPFRYRVAVRTVGST